MECINASITPMEEVEIFGIPALYTPYKVSRRTVHLGLYCYELQAGPADGQPHRLMDRADAGYSGTVLTPVPVEGTGGRGAAIGPGDFQPGLGRGPLYPGPVRGQVPVPRHGPGPTGADLWEGRLNCSHFSPISCGPIPVPTSLTLTTIYAPSPALSRSRTWKTGRSTG